jgi:dCMP deaminase
MRSAKHFSTFSKDPSTKVGAVFVRDNRIVAHGWNGFPRWFDDSADKYADREYKYKFVVHAEANCVYNAAREGTCLKGCEVYVHGLTVCSKCALGLVQAGVGAVHMCAPPPESETARRWRDDFKVSRYVLDRGRIEFGVYCEMEGAGGRYESRSSDEYADDPRTFSPRPAF